MRLLIRLCSITSFVFNLILAQNLTDSSALSVDISLPEGETFGQCNRQLDVELHKRNCRYGKCENIKNGTDYVCHCDLHITGRRCDQPAKYLRTDSQTFFQTYNPCSSNPCWGESVCVLLNTDIDEYKCECPKKRYGKYCNLKIQEYHTVNSTNKQKIVNNSSRISIDSVNETLTIDLKLLFKTTTIEPINKTKSVNICNKENCRLGVCSENGTCTCSYPILGKNCDKIDECIITNCINGYCETGQGCICNKGFTGENCEIDISTTTKLPDTTLKTVLTTTTKLNLKIFMNKNRILKCENGGILIENICICLNQFSGLRCEKPPDYIFDSDTSRQDLTTDQLIINKIIPKSSNFEFQNENNNFEFKFSNLKNLNATFLKSIVWPWKECFPGNSQVKIFDTNKNTIISSKMSDLKQNDLVLVLDDSNRIKLSRIINFLHRIENIRAEFIRLHFKLNLNDIQHITLTPKHLIYIKSHDNAYFKYISSDLVTLNDKIQFYDSESKLIRLVSIIRIERLNLSHGIYAPLTEEGSLLVDNVKVSCYSIIRFHYLGSAYFGLMQFFNRFFKFEYDIVNKIIYDFLSLFQIHHLLFFT